MDRTVDDIRVAFLEQMTAELFSGVIQREILRYNLMCYAHRDLSSAVLFCSG